MGALITSEGVRRYMSRRKEFSSLESRLSETRKRLAVKQQHLARAKKDEDFLEREARRHLGLIRPDEIEFRFLSGPAAPGTKETMQRQAPAAKRGG